MRIAVAKPDQAGEGWLPFPAEWKTPAEIRAAVYALQAAEDHTREAWEMLSPENAFKASPFPEIQFCTMNRTVLDMVTSAKANYVGPVTFDEVVVWVEGRGLVPLLDLKDEAWLSHFTLGDLYDREKF
jgi:hypothetical protein